MGPPLVRTGATRPDHRAGHRARELAYLLREAREPAAMPALAPIEWRLDGFALVQSVSLPQGSRYKIRKSWKG